MNSAQKLRMKKLDLINIYAKKNNIWPDSTLAPFVTWTEFYNLLGNLLTGLDNNFEPITLSSFHSGISKADFMIELDELSAPLDKHGLTTKCCNMIYYLITIQSDPIHLGSNQNYFESVPNQLESVPKHLETSITNHHEQNQESYFQESDLIVKQEKKEEIYYLHNVIDVEPEIVAIIDLTVEKKEVNPDANLSADLMEPEGLDKDNILTAKELREVAEKVLLALKSGQTNVDGIDLVKILFDDIEEKFFDIASNDKNEAFEGKPIIFNPHTYVVVLRDEMKKFYDEHFNDFATEEERWPLYISLCVYVIYNGQTWRVLERIGQHNQGLDLAVRHAQDDKLRDVPSILRRYWVFSNLKKSGRKLIIMKMNHGFLNGVFNSFLFNIENAINRWFQIVFDLMQQNAPKKIIKTLSINKHCNPQCSRLYDEIIAGLPAFAGFKHERIHDLHGLLLIKRFCLDLFDEKKQDQIFDY